MNESLRKKSEREQNYDERNEKLTRREKNYEKKEKELNRRIKAEQNSKRRGRFKIKNTGKQVIEQIQSRDPLGKYRNILPFHWITILLLIVLMLAIAQKK